VTAATTTSAGLTVGKGKFRMALTGVGVACPSPAAAQAAKINRAINAARIDPVRSKKSFNR
jgi:hypothetical protein